MAFGIAQAQGLQCVNNLVGSDGIIITITYPCLHSENLLVVPKEAHLLFKIQGKSPESKLALCICDTHTRYCLFCPTRSLAIRILTMATRVLLKAIRNTRFLLTSPP